MTLQRAKLCIDLGRYKEALTLLNPLLADGGSLDAFRLTYSAHANLGNIRAARRVTEQGLSRWPQEASLHANLASALHALSLSFDGLKAVRRAIQLDPEWHGYHYLEAGILNHLRQFDAAEAASRRALRLQPDDADYMWLLAAILTNKSRYDEARSIVQKGLAISANHADLLMLKGRLEMERPERIRHFRDSLRVNPLGRDAQNLLHKEEVGRRQGRVVAVAASGALGLLYVLNAPQWISTLLFVLSALWLVNVAYLPMLWVTASCYAYFNLARDISNGPVSPQHFGAATEWLGNILASAAMGGFWSLMVIFVWMIILQQPGELLKNLRLARSNDVLPEKLRELSASKRSLFNVAVCALPALWPLVMHFASNSGETYVWILFTAELLVFILARMLFLPRTGRYMMLLLLLYFVMVISAVFASKAIHLMTWELGNQLCASVLVGIGSLLLVNFSITHGERIDGTGSA